jgi:(4-alkanoyl-5-oxo-2,5-dihydrofuran-3-yl)methyl phosphate reductase
MRLLITGASGEIGRQVVKQLVRCGERPRIFVRDAMKAGALFGRDVEMTVGDFTDAAALSRALNHIDAVLCITAGPDLARHDESVAGAARSNRVSRVVKLSSFDARVNVGTGVWHAAGEAAIRESGVPFTFVQPSGFMNNMLHWAPSVRTRGVVRSATGNGRIPFIHPRDIVDVIVQTLTTEGFVGEALPITGPEALSYAEMAERIGSALGKPVGFMGISMDEARREQAASGESDAVINAHLSIFQAIYDGTLAQVTDTVERVLGRKAAGIDQWIAENVTAFEGGADDLIH